MRGEGFKFWGELKGGDKGFSKVILFCELPHDDTRVVLTLPEVAT